LLLLLPEAYSPTLLPENASAASALNALPDYLLHHKKCALVPTKSRKWRKFEENP
jgi:hypothetical protein